LFELAAVICAISYRGGTLAGVPRLDGEVILLTGAAGGLGAPMARVLHACGARLVLADIDAAGTAALAAELKTDALALTCDVREPGAWAETVAAAEDHFGPIRGLVNNAGITAVHRFEEVTAAQLLELTRANQFSVIYGMQAVFPGMLAAGGGAIVNITSISASYGVGWHAGYAAAKGAVRALTLCAAAEWASHSIRVNTIAPGTIDTPMARGGAYASLANFDERVAAMVPLGRAGTPDQVAAMVAYLLSPDGAFCTGADFVIDGGQSAGRLRSLA
jgi:3alpha(or 20beta)-hydroxysteroid dehydrogenase